MTPVENLAALTACMSDRRDRAAFAYSLEQHVRNGRGFWPVVEMDGVRKVIAFRSASSGAGRWTMDQGRVEVLDLHQISMSDWPKIKITVN